MSTSVATRQHALFGRTEHGPSTAFDRWVLSRIRHGVATAPVRFALWDGFVISPASRPAIAGIVFKNRRALVSCAWDPELNFGEACMWGGLEVEGDLFELFDATYRAMAASKPRPWWRWQPPNDIHTARSNVHRHYDLGNDFYRLWLDREMLYTCAYFPTPDTGLEEAQIAKMDLVCRKIRLKPGDRVVEAGCGWGALAVFMARRYGAVVKAFNVSAEQVAFAREKAQTAGVADRVEFIEDDYRNVRGRFDAFVSVGMLEHVGRADYPTLGRVMDDALAPNGRGFLHFIGRDRPGELNAWIRKRIFPGAYPPTLREVFEGVLEPRGFSVVHVENLRMHYARTLDHWRRRFDAASARVAEMFDESFVRAWRVYLAGSEASFTAGSMQLFQVVFERGGGATQFMPWDACRPLADGKSDDGRV